MTDDAEVDEREFLLRSLRDLDAERAAGDIDEADYVALRDDYTARAAAALRGEGATDPPPARPRQRLRRAVAVAGVLAVGAATGEVLARTVGERVEGQEVTGSTAAPTTPLERAKALFDQGKLVDAVRAFDAVLEDDPDNAEALAYHGWIVHLAGLSDDAMSWLDRAIAADPGYPFAHFFKGLVLLQGRDDPAGAVASLERFLASDPPEGMVAPAPELLRSARDAAAGRVPTSAPPP